MTRKEREDSIDIIQSILNKYEEDECLVTEITIGDEDIKALKIAIKALEQEAQTFEWCHDCLEYNQDKHCCPRFNKVIRNTVEEMKQSKVGHWIYEKRKRLINETDEGAEYVTDYWCKCSKCGGDFGYRKMKDAFCKYCGAKMVESQESEEKE